MSGHNQLRIIGGSHRRRIISFPTSDGMRPTGNRIRETLFNWLEPDIAGTNCLDLFAGSGALGFESLSRGARAATLLETNKSVAVNLKDNAAKLGFTNAQVIQSEARQWLISGVSSDLFDVAFIDPPFADNLLYDCCANLSDSQLLAEDAKVYLELDKEIDGTKLPSGWSEIKNNCAGRVHFGLYLVSGAPKSVSSMSGMHS